MNVRGLMKSKESTAVKLEYIKNVIRDYNLNIIFLQELKIHHDSKKDIKIDWKKHFKKWKFFSDDKKETGILIKKEIQVTEVGKFKNKNKGNQWCTWIIIYCKGQKIAMGSYYRSPSARKGNKEKKKTLADIRLMTNEIAYIKQKHQVKSFIFGGDTNICSSSWDKNCDDSNINDVNELFEFMNDNDMEYINNNYKPTYAKKRDGKIVKYKIIDLIFVSKNLQQMVSGYTTNSENDGNDLINSNFDIEWVNNFSDHFMVKWNINKKINDDDKISETWRLNSNHWNEFEFLLESMITCITDDKIKIEI